MNFRRNCVTKKSKMCVLRLLKNRFTASRSRIRAASLEHSTRSWQQVRSCGNIFVALPSARFLKMPLMWSRDNERRDRRSRKSQKFVCFSRFSTRREFSEGEINLHPQLCHRSGNAILSCRVCETRNCIMCLISWRGAKQKLFCFRNP